MIFDRLSLGKILLSNDGVQFQSIDDKEQANFKQLSSYIFGESNFVANIIVDATPKNDPLLISTSHEYMIGYFKDKSCAKLSSWGMLHPLNQELQALVKGLSPKLAMEKLDLFYEKNNLKKDNISNYKYVDKKGIYRTGPLDDPQGKGPKDERINIKTGGILKIPSRGWSCNIDTWEEWCQQGLIHFPDTDDVLASKKTYLDNNKLEVGRSVIKVQTRKSTNTLNNIFNTKKVFNNPKPIDLLETLINLCANPNLIILDYFAGSGTTAHAVINLNREDNGNRQYILVEQGEYFDTVLKPRVQKVIYSENWKDGKPVPSEKPSDGLNGVSQIVKVLKLESYEDTLNNLQLQRSDLLDSLPEQAQHDYLLNYMLDIESRGSLLNVSHFAKPFDYGLNISTTSAGAYDWQKVDLVETFNYLIGAKVISVDDKRSEQGFVAVECRLPNQHADEKTLVFWRDCERMGYGELQKHFDRLGINPADSEYGQIYLNGDHTLETVWDGEQSGSLKILSIEDAFLSLMFEGDA